MDGGANPFFTAFMAAKDWGKKERGFRDTRLEDGQDGHDPNKAPPAGFKSWAEVGKHNEDVLGAALERQNELEAQGYRYNSSDGTWVGPDGDVTTLSSSGQQSGGGFQKPQGGGLAVWGRQ